MKFGINPYDVAFFLSAPVVALLSLRLERRWFIFGALGVAALIGWALEFGSDNWVDAQWTALMERTPNPSKDLIQQYDSDGASKAATLLFGLPLAAVYSAIWFGVLYGARRIIRSRGQWRSP